MRKSLKIAPGSLIIRNFSSSMGSLFDKQFDALEKLPKGMDPDDLKQLHDYFDLIALKSLSNYLNKATKVEVANDFDEDYVELFDENFLA
jgi:hypothetical protein